MRRLNRYVLLDRDGTITVEKNYLSSADQVELVHNAAAGMRALRSAGFGLIVVTNQSGIGRGYFSESTLDEIHLRLQEMLRAEGIKLDGILFCPHTPEDDCCCRKPRPGLVERAAAEIGFEPEMAIVIGDKECDIDLGRRCGATTILVRSGYGADQEKLGVLADYICDDLLAAAEILASRTLEPERELLCTS